MPDDLNPIILTDSHGMNNEKPSGKNTTTRLIFGVSLLIHGEAGSRNTRPRLAFHLLKHGVHRIPRNMDVVLSWVRRHTTF